MGSFNIKGSCFSLSERTWVTTADGTSANRIEGGGGGGGGGQEGIKGSVAPSDVHAFCRSKPQASIAKALGGDLLATKGRERAGGRYTEPGDGEEDGACCCYAIYLHCRQEARVVHLREAVAIEVLPLGYELATFSLVTELHLTPPNDSSSSNSSIGVQQQRQRDDDAGANERQGKEKDEHAQVVRWAALGLSDMFNSSAAFTAQDSNLQADLSDNASSLGNLGPGGVDGGGGGGGGSSGGGLIPGVALSIKGSGKFLAVASRRPARATLSRGRRAHLGISGGGDGDGDGDGVGVVLEVSFTALAGGDEVSIAPEKRGSIKPKGGMGLVELIIPAPWDGRERRLVFWWEG